MSLVERQQRLRLLLQLEPIVRRWSAHLAHGDGQRLEVREYVRTLAELQVGLVREVRRPGRSRSAALLIVDEFAESVRFVPRPRLSSAVRRALERELAAACQLATHVQPREAE